MSAWSTSAETAGTLLEHKWPKRVSYRAALLEIALTCHVHAVFSEDAINNTRTSFSTRSSLPFLSCRICFGRVTYKLQLSSTSNLTTISLPSTIISKGIVRSYQMPPKSNSISDKVAYILCESSDVILYLGRVSKSANDEPANTGSSVLKYKRLDEVLDWLETNHMTRELKDRTGLDKVRIRQIKILPTVICTSLIFFNQVLKSLYSKSDWRFPKRYQDRAKSLIRIFEAEGWGEDEDNVSSSHSRPAEHQRSIASATRNFQSARSTDAVIRLPPPNHSIWGVDGIYHGVALKVKDAGRGKSRRSLVLDSRYASERKDAKVILTDKRVGILGAFC